MDSFYLILGFNAVILCIAGILFGWDKALYSILFQYASAMVLHLMYKKFQQSTLFIVTNRPAEVCQAIYAVSRHGATILDGEEPMNTASGRWYTRWFPLRRRKKVIHAVQKVDASAFINEIKNAEAAGTVYVPKEK